MRDSHEEIIWHFIHHAEVNFSYIVAAIKSTS